MTGPLDTNIGKQAISTLNRESHLNVIFFVNCRSTDNAAIYDKVIADNGEPESINDKRTLCILLARSLSIVVETFRSKFFSFNDLDALEEMVQFSRDISWIIFKVVTEKCGIQYAKYNPRTLVFFPLIQQARQYKIHSILCHILSMLSELKEIKYFQKCKQVGVLNHFLTTLQPSRFFLDKFLLKHQHFHEVLPPRPKPVRKYMQKYY